MIKFHFHLKRDLLCKKVGDFMSIGLIRHSGFVSFCGKNNPVPFYTTKEPNEKIYIKQEGGEPRTANSITFMAMDTLLYIEPEKSDNGSLLVVDPYSSWEYTYEDISYFTVIGDAGQKIRWYAQFH